MADWKITEAISNGIEKGLDKIADKISEGIIELFSKIGIALLDGAGVLIIILAIYYIFKYMFTTKKEKQEDNVNVLVCLGGIYFIVKMFGVMLN